MTGHGFAQSAGSGLSVTVELRSINNRHLKVNVRGSSPYPTHEQLFEKLIKKSIQRGTVQLHIQVSRSDLNIQSTLNTSVMLGYVNQITQACEHAGKSPDVVNALLAGVLALPGISSEDGTTSCTIPEDEWPTVEQTVLKAMEQLRESRRREGNAMAQELGALHDKILASFQKIQDHLPTVRVHYHDRLLERVRQTLQSTGVAVEPCDVIREVALFLDRTDVHEEIARLTAHLTQFRDLITRGSADGAGRRLEFLVQEIGREINTLGSKAPDTFVSNEVIEMKSAMEKIRELIQNVE